MIIVSISRCEAHSFWHISPFIFWIIILMENKKLVLSIAALALVASVTIGSTYANDLQNDRGEREPLTVEQQAERDADKAEMKASIEAAVIANDFTAFQTIVEEHKAEKEAKRSEEGANRPNRERPELSEEEKVEKMEERFEKLTTYYAENGELPEMKKWKKGKRGGNCNK